jgi:hypothetical protein
VVLDWLTEEVHHTDLLKYFGAKLGYDFSYLR